MTALPPDPILAVTEHRCQPETPMSNISALSNTPVPAVAPSVAPARLKNCRTYSPFLRLRSRAMALRPSDFTNTESVTMRLSARLAIDDACTLCVELTAVSRTCVAVPVPSGALCEVDGSVVSTFAHDAFEKSCDLMTTLVRA